MAIDDGIRLRDGGVDTPLISFMYRGRHICNVERQFFHVKPHERQVFDVVEIGTDLIENYAVKQRGVTTPQLCGAVLQPVLENVALRVIGDYFTTEVKEILVRVGRVCDATAERGGLRQAEFYLHIDGIIYEYVGSAVVLLVDGKLEAVAVTALENQTFNGLVAAGVDISQLSHKEANRDLHRRSEYELQSRKLGGALQAYLAVQSLLNDCPQAIESAEKKFVPPPHVNSKKKNQKRKPPKAYRVIRLVSQAGLERAESTGSGNKVFLCPAWGVRGHYRHLGSGKVTWVRAHTKGVARAELAAYSPKTYVSRC